MYISVQQGELLDNIIKPFEVALRTFVASTIIKKYNSELDFNKKINEIKMPKEVIYSKKMNSRVNKIKSNSGQIYATLEKISDCKKTKEFNLDVPYLSEIIEIILVLFNSDFESENITKGFSSIEEFHYSCHVFHKTRNDLSHPASRPTPLDEATKIISFIENASANIPIENFWYVKQESIYEKIKEYRSYQSKERLKFNNIDNAKFNHRSLICREDIIERMYQSLIGDSTRKRLAGSIVLYGYGGVGKTAITLEFLLRLMRDKSDGKIPEINYLLFFSSKDEYLRENETTGELYIDSYRPEFTCLDELKQLICKSLGLKSIDELGASDERGIIAIDNIENLDSTEKEKIILFIKSLPRSIQFIVTSRSEEQCEEKIHISEFKNDNTGHQFIKEIIESTNLDIEYEEDESSKIIDVSKGNSLIIIQVLNIISRGVSSHTEITTSLENLRSKNTEMIASFMYKNTFDHAINSIEMVKIPAKYIIQIISLYDEKIELYSISKLTRIDISIAEKVCKFLLERLILSKSGEYYQLNEFAKKFVFIKLLPDRFELNKIKDKIRQHKERMNQKLTELDSTLEKDQRLRDIVLEWQPRNYIDKIVIAELFSLYGEAIKFISKRDKEGFENCLKNFDDHIFITKHPYVPLQKARLLKEGLYKIYRDSNHIKTQVEHLYEEAIESIEYECRHLLGSFAHASLLMYFGVFLTDKLKDDSRAIRFLEQSKMHFGNNKGKGWFITCNYLTQAYKKMFERTKDSAYKAQMIKLVREVLSQRAKIDRSGFDIEKYSKTYSHLI